MTERVDSVEFEEARDICFISIKRLAAIYRNGKALPVEIVRSLLGRVDRYEEYINAWITIRREELQVEAERTGQRHQAG